MDVMLHRKNGDELMAEIAGGQPGYPADYPPDYPSLVVLRRATVDTLFVHEGRGHYREAAPSPVVRVNGVIEPSCS